MSRKLNLPVYDEHSVIDTTKTSYANDAEVSNLKVIAFLGQT